MLKNIFFSGLLLFSVDIITAQDRSFQASDNNQISLLIASKKYNTNKPLKSISLEDYIRNDNSNTVTEDSSSPNFFRKLAMQQGALKAGIALGVTAPIITGAEVSLSDSEVLSTTVNFIKDTQVPFLAGEFQYMITNDLAVGGFAGYTQGDVSNRNTKGVNQKIKTSGFLVGGSVSYYLPFTSWLYVPIYGEVSYERGKYDSTDGQIIENYEYFRIRPSLGAGVAIVLSDVIHIEIRGGDVSYKKSQFVQTKKIDSTDGTNLLLDQSIKANRIQFGLNPTIRLMLVVFGKSKSNR